MSEKKRKVEEIYQIPWIKSENMSVPPNLVLKFIILEQQKLLQEQTQRIERSKLFICKCCDKYQSEYEITKCKCCSENICEDCEFKHVCIGTCGICTQTDIEVNSFEPESYMYIEKYCKNCILKYEKQEEEEDK